MRELSVPNERAALQPCRRLLTTGEVARVLRRSQKQVQRLTDEGALPCGFKTSHGDRLYQWPDVLRVLEQWATHEARTRAQRLAAIRPTMLGVHDLRLRLYRPGERDRPALDGKDRGIVRASRGV